MNRTRTFLASLLLLGSPGAALADTALCEIEAAQFAEKIAATRPGLPAETHRRLIADASLLCLRALGGQQALAAPDAEPPAAVEPDEPPGPSWGERMLQPTETKAGHKRLRRK